MVGNPAGNAVGNCEVQGYLRSSRHSEILKRWQNIDILRHPSAWPPTERALSQKSRRCGRLSESNWPILRSDSSYISSCTHLTHNHNRRARVLHQKGYAVESGSVIVRY
eukprot:6175927-Pleurochrysis_carterae.AAC.8